MELLFIAHLMDPFGNDRDLYVKMGHDKSLHYLLHNGSRSMALSNLQLKTKLPHWASRTSALTYQKVADAVKTGTCKPLGASYPPDDQCCPHCGAIL